MRFVLVLLLAAPALSAQVLGDDGVYVLAETAPAPVGGMAAIADALVYPEAALASEAEGTVVLTFVVDPDGSVRDAVVARAPHAALGEAALAAVATLPFTAGLVGDEPVATRMSLPIRFVLPETEPEWADQPASPVGGWERVFEPSAWPPRLQGSETEYTFTLFADIDAEGHVTDASIRAVESEGGRIRTQQVIIAEEEVPMHLQEGRQLRAEGEAAREQMLLDMVRAARFTPEIRDGQAVASQIEVVLTVSPSSGS
ncbi:TonB family protein [Rubrivirga sp. IMCC45206]|uniref:TonB family protein n=1 Tax=Rubrivirga sp. IMCC45206 TaxID=3391614 RepID=UPI00398FB46E